MSAARTKRDIAADVTAKIIEALEKGGTSIWTKPWNGDGGFFTHRAPHNAVTGKPYRGVNTLLLWLAEMSAGYVDPRWVTFKQAQKLGGTVRKGQKGTHIVFYKFLEKEEKTESGETKKSRIPMMRNYVVFNVQQCEGLDVEDYDANVAPNPGTVADELADRLGINVIRANDRACYSCIGDYITVPAMEAFKTEGDYAATLLHEIVHWTGHESRLGREFGHRFTDAYAFEELVAEIGSAFLCAAMGVQGELQHANYVQVWLGILKADRKAIFAAASAAQKAVDLLLGAEYQEEAEAA